MLTTRILTAAVLIPLTLGALFWLGPIGWGVFTLAIVGVAAVEWAELAEYRRTTWLLFVAGTLLIGLDLLFVPVSGFETQSGWPEAITLVVCGAATLFWLLLAPAWLATGWRVDSKLALAVVGWLVLIATWVAVVQIRARSPWLLLALMAIVWIADSAAYFSGRAFGKRKLAPTISPGKTWEGVFGAWIAVVVYALALAPFAAAAGYSGERSVVAVITWIAIAIALSAISVMG